MIVPQRQAEGAIRRRAVLQAHLLQLARQHPAAAGRQHLPPEVFFDDGLDARDLAGHRVGPDQAAGRPGVTSNELGDGDEQDLVALRGLEITFEPQRLEGAHGREGSQEQLVLAQARAEPLVLRAVVSARRPLLRAPQE